MADRLDVLLGILLDKAAQKDVERGLSDIQKGVEGLDKTSTKAGQSMGDAWDEMGDDFEKFNKVFNERFKLINGKMVDLVTGSKVAASSLRDFQKINLDDPARDLEAVAAANADVAKQAAIAKAAEKELAKQIRDVGRVGGLDEDQVRDLPEDLFQAGVELAKLEEKFSKTRSEIVRLNQASAGIARLSGILAVAGGAIVGSIALSAGQYVKFIENAGIKGDETAERWIAASKKVKNAQLNLGEAAAQAILPIYEKAAALAEKVAGFVARNPDLIKAALNTGLVVATLGAVGAAASKGIKIYADFKYLAATATYDLATRRFQTSVREFLAGSVLKPTGGQIAQNLRKSLLPTAGGIAGASIASIAAVVVSVLGGVAVGASIYQLIAKATGRAGLGEISTGGAYKAGQAFGKIAGLDEDEIERKATVFAAIVGKLTGVIDKSDPLWIKAANSVEGLSGALREFDQEATKAQATDAFIQYRQQEQQAEENYMQQRAQIVEQGARQIAQIEANYADQRTKLIESFAASSAQAVSNFQFQQEQAAEQFALSEANAARDFNERRAEEREAFQQSEQRSREDHLREMRKLEEDHQDRVRDLVASRDALGLVKEKRDYLRQKRDAEEEFRVDSQRRKQDFQRRQRDQEEEFLQERARRRQEFAFRQQQAAEQFAYQQEQAKAQFEERLNQLDEQYRLELSKAKQQNAERLRELDLQYRQEQITRRNAFYDILRDLDANLLNEETLRKQYYARMQADLEKFLSDTAGAVGSNLPGYGETHAAGGYGPGYVGSGEFVASRSTTGQLERMIGGRLTQQSMQSLAAGGGSTVVNLSLPGGLVTTKMLTESLDKNTAQFLKSLTKGLV